METFLPILRRMVSDAEFLWTGNRSHQELNDKLKQLRETHNIIANIERRELYLIHDGPIHPIFLRSFQQVEDLFNAIDAMEKNKASNEQIDLIEHNLEEFEKAQHTLMQLMQKKSA